MYECWCTCISIFDGLSGIENWCTMCMTSWYCSLNLACSWGRDVNCCCLVLQSYLARPKVFTSVDQSEREWMVIIMRPVFETRIAVPVETSWTDCTFGLFCTVLCLPCNVIFHRKIWSCPNPPTYFMHVDSAYWNTPRSNRQGVSVSKISVLCPIQIPVSHLLFSISFFTHLLILLIFPVLTIGMAMLACWSACWRLHPARPLLLCH